MCTVNKLLQRERERESTRDYQLVGNSHLAKDLSCGESSELWGNLSFPTNIVMGIFGFFVFYLLNLSINLSFLRKSPQVCKIYHCRCYHSTSIWGCWDIFVRNSAGIKLVSRIQYFSIWNEERRTNIVMALMTELGELKNFKLYSRLICIVLYL